MIWNKTIGGFGTENGYSVIEATDGGIIIAGSTSSFANFGTTDLYIVKLSATGNLAWTRTVDANSSEIGYSITRTTDGNIVIVGSISSNDFYVVKMREDGNVVWAKRISKLGSEVAYSVIETSDGGIVVGGYDSNNNRLVVVKLDSGGNLLWAKEISGAGFVGVLEVSILEASDGGLIIASSTSFGQGGNDIYLVKLRADGSSSCPSGCVVSSISPSTTNTSYVNSGGNIGTLNNLSVSDFGTPGSGGVLTNICP